MITLDGRLCHRATLAVPWRGLWVATAALDGEVPRGRVTLKWGAAALIGTVDPGDSGVWQGEALVTLVGGAGWSTVLPPLWTQNDAGLLGSQVAQQVAAAAGEVLTAPASAFRTLGTGYVRPRRSGATTLTDVLSSTATWWVEYGGGTGAGTRPSPSVPAGVEILELLADERWAELDAADPSLVLVGSVFAAAPPRRLVGYRIMELRAEASADGQRICAAVERTATI